MLVWLGGASLPAGAFDCAEKHCSQMESCAEAYHHLTVCGEGKRDADGDGIPCENVCGKTEEELQRLLGPAAQKLPQMRQSAPTVTRPGAPASPASPQADALSAQPEAPGLSCAGKRRCGEMRSCEEARFYLSKCGVGSLDRDGDGVPCESLCGG